MNRKFYLQIPLNLVEILLKFIDLLILNSLVKILQEYIKQ